MRFYQYSVGERNGDSECAATQMHMKIFRTRKIWRVSYVSVQEFFEFHMKQKQVIFKCFSLQALLIFQKEEEKVRCIQSPLCKRNWVTIPEHLCRLVSSPMVDAYAKPVIQSWEACRVQLFSLPTQESMHIHNIDTIPNF